MLRLSSYILLLLAVLGVVGIGSLLGLGIGQKLFLMTMVFSLVWLASASPQDDAKPGRTQSVDPVQGLPTGFGRELLREMPSALIIVSETQRVIYANPAAKRMLPAIRTGSHIATVIRAPAFIEAIETVMQDHENLRFSFTMIAQKERYFEARAAYVPKEAFSDFGDTGQAIIQIEDRTRDKALLQTRSDFVANASHELRTPLSSIIGYIETLQGHAREDPAAREVFLDIMLNQALRMKRLVDDLMSLSRIEMNAHIAPEGHLDLYLVATESANALFPVASQNDVLLQIELPADAPGPMVRGDRDQLSQVVSNLVDNAIKYGGPGKKVRVACSSPDPRYPGKVGVSVIDEGPGISRENIPRITERFFRVSGGKNKDTDGTGLGLAITKHIMARHGGVLDVKSTLGEGSCFTLWIPELRKTGAAAAE